MPSRLLACFGLVVLVACAACGGGEADAPGTSGAGGGATAGSSGASGSAGSVAGMAGAGGKKITCKHHPSKITIVDAGCEDCVLETCCAAVNACEDSPACLDCWQKGGGGSCWSNLEWSQFYKCIYAPTQCGSTCAGKCGGFDAGEPCTTCVRASCCDEWAACAGDPLCADCVTKGGQLCLDKPPELLTAAETCTDQHCAMECGTPQPICDSGATVPGDKACATCLGASCCAEFKACFGDSACLACLQGAPGDCTAQKPTIDALQTCVTTCKECSP